jgi:NADPH:quinone reductase-like Zn-dependent oxidoreductase
MIHSAAGGVGLAALDVCVHAGAEVWGSAGPSKHELLRSRGCAHVLSSHDDAWPEVGMDLILDPVGGKSWKRGFEALRTGGRLVCFGFSAMSPGDRPSRWKQLQAVWAIPWTSFNPVTFMNENKGAMGVNMGHMWSERERLAGWLVEILEGWKVGWVRPHVHATFPFDRAAEAHAMLHNRQASGKVVLVPQ